MSLSITPSCLKEVPPTTTTSLTAGSTWINMSPSYTNTYIYTESLMSILSYGASGTGTPNSTFVCVYQA
jgi:hypothetical protein